MKILWGELTSTSLKIKRQKEPIKTKLHPGEGQDVRYDFLNVPCFKFGYTNFFFHNIAVYLNPVFQFSSSRINSASRITKSCESLHNFERAPTGFIKKHKALDVGWGFSKNGNDIGSRRASCRYAMHSA